MTNELPQRAEMFADILFSRVDERMGDRDAALTMVRGVVSQNHALRCSFRYKDFWVAVEIPLDLIEVDPDFQPLAQYHAGNIVRAFRDGDRSNREAALSFYEGIVNAVARLTGLNDLGSSWNYNPVTKVVTVSFRGEDECSASTELWSQLRDSDRQHEINSLARGIAQDILFTVPPGQLTWRGRCSLLAEACTHPGALINAFREIVKEAVSEASGVPLEELRCYGEYHSHHDREPGFSGMDSLRLPPPRLIEVDFTFYFPDFPGHYWEGAGTASGIRRLAIQGRLAAEIEAFANSFRRSPPIRPWGIEGIGRLPTIPASGPYRYERSPEPNPYDSLQWRSLNYNDEQPLPGLEAVSCCSRCVYLMRGFKTGEPHICNAFHSMTSIYTPVECPDYTEH